MLTNKCAVVTGGTAGIGLGIARVLLDHGASVMVAGRSLDRGKAALADLDADERAHFIQTDVRHRAQVERMIHSAVDAFGQVDVLVNNAGGVHPARPFTAMPDDDEFEAHFRWNFWPSVWAARSVLEHMLPRGWGRIVNITSVGGMVGFPLAAPYVAAKHAVNGFTKSLALEVGPRGVTVNAVAPGYVETDLANGFFPSVAQAMGIEHTALVAQLTSGLGRAVRPEEVGAIVAMVASDLGGAINGAVLAADGGYTAV